jgi:hypothetical protein
VQKRRSVVLQAFVLCGGSTRSEWYDIRQLHSVYLSR